MSTGLPQITLTGRVASEPRTQFTQANGHCVSTMRVVSSNRIQGDDGQWQDKDVCWLDVVTWRKLAEAVAETITKGTIVSVTGELRTRSYEDREGAKRQAYEVINASVAVGLLGQDVTVTRSAPGQGATTAPAAAPAASTPASAPAPAAAPAPQPALVGGGSVLEEPPF